MFSVSGRSRVPGCVVYTSFVLLIFVLIKWLNVHHNDYSAYIQSNWLWAQTLSDRLIVRAQFYDVLFWRTVQRSDGETSMAECGTVGRIAIAKLNNTNYRMWSLKSSYCWSETICGTLLSMNNPILLQMNGREKIERLEQRSACYLRTVSYTLYEKSLQQKLLGMLWSDIMRSQHCQARSVC